jgi:hypothetical protein
MDASLIDNEGRGRVPSSADALDHCNLLVIAWLNKLRSSVSLCTCDDLYRANHAYLEASLVKVMHVVVVDAVLSFSLLYQLELRANYLWILLEYSLPILSLIEGYFKLS